MKGGRDGSVRREEEGEGDKIMETRLETPVAVPDEWCLRVSVWWHIVLS